MTRLRPALTAIVGALALALAVPAAASAAAPAAPELLPVWATFDGDTPIDGARVDVYVDGRRLAQSSGVRLERTHSTGAAVLELPRQLRAFTVVVTGGKAHGRAVRGSLRADVRGYGPAPHVVHVNPVTTLIAAKVRRGYGPKAAARIIRRRLGIPHWHDVSGDVRRSDDWFGGDAFLAASADEGLAELVTRLSRPGHPRRVFRDAQARGSVIALAPIAAYLKDPALNLLKDFATNKGKEIVAQILSGTGLAGADVFDSSDIKEIRARFDQVDAKLLELKGLVEGLSVTLNETLYSTSVSPVITALGNIRTATENIAFLASMDPKDPTKRGLAAEYAEFIRSNLQGAPQTLDGALGGEGADPLAPNILRAGSRLVASRTRFYGAAESAKARAVYDYYALAQARAAWALSFYWRSRPDTFSEATIRASLAKITKAVEDQEKKWVKPPVPGDVIVDRNSGLMWGRSPGFISGRAFWESYRNKSTLAVGASKNLRVPTLGEWGGLVKDVSGSRSAWLAREARMSPAPEGLQWANDSVYGDPFGLFRDLYLQVTYFDLDTGKKYDYCFFGELGKCLKWYSSRLGPRDLLWLERRKGQVMLVRNVGAGEYWWP